MKFLVISDVTESFHECWFPRVEFNRLDVIENLIHQSCSCVFILLISLRTGKGVNLHLLALEFFHEAGYDAVDGDHDYHDEDSGEHTHSDEVIQTCETENDLQGCRPHDLSVLSDILKALGVYSHEIDDISCRLGLSSVIR